MKGDVVLFNETMLEFGKGTLDLSSDTLKVGIVDDTITPAADDATPTWGDYSANEVATTGNYTAGGETLTTVTWAMVSDLATLGADDVVIAEDPSGFTDGYWGIIYDDTHGSDHALGFVQLHDGVNPESEQAGDVSIEWTGGVVAEFPANVAA